MKVMSFNIQNELHQEEKIPDIVALIRKLDPDIAGLQEVMPESMIRLRELLDEYYCYGLPRDGRNSRTSETCPILVKKKYEITGQDTCWLSASPDTEGSAFRFSSFPRNVNMVTFMYEGKEVSYFNTHLEWILESVRIKQAEVLVNFMQGHDNCILTGDFNAQRDFTSFKKIKKEYDCLTEGINECTIHRKGKKFIRKLPIDHIFISRNMKCDSVTVIKDMVDDRYVSDHYPLIAEIIL